MEGAYNSNQHQLEEWKRAFGSVERRESVKTLLIP